MRGLGQFLESTCKNHSFGKIEFPSSFKKKKIEKIEEAKRFKEEARSEDSEDFSRSGGEINRGAGRVYRIKATRCARTRRNSSGFRQAAGSCAAWLRSVTHRLPAYQWTRPRATRSREIDSLSFSLSLSLYPSTGCARSFNSCTPPENRFHECKSPSPTVRGESERRSVHTRVSMRRCLPAQDRERKESVQNGQVVSAVYWIS